MKVFTLACLFLCLSLALPTPSSGGAVFTYRSPESPTDQRYQYDNKLLQLALEKTRPTWGEYTLVPSPVMNYSRAIEMLTSGELENPMFKISADNELCKRIKHVPFPVDLGIVGYRLFFTSETINRQLKSVRNIEHLKQFNMGQGFRWLDVRILNAAGFQVVTIPTYESLFHMVATKRFDLFPRGINEIKMEYDAHRDIPQLTLNTDIGIYYPLPRFYFTDNDGDDDASRRVYEGLVTAFHDGSLQELWEQEYRPSLTFGRIQNVKFFEIKNPFIDQIDDTYKQFLINIR